MEVASPPWPVSLRQTFFRRLQALGGVCIGEEDLGIAVFWRGVAVQDLSQVCRKVRLSGGTLQHVVAGDAEVEEVLHREVALLKFKCSTLHLPLQH
jgi:hypothetical protein